MWSNMEDTGQSRPDFGLGFQVTALKTFQFQLGSGMWSSMGHVRQSRPDSGPGFQVKALEAFSVVPSSLGRGTPKGQDLHRKTYRGT